MKVVIRADASPRIGTGHVFRCLALGRALQQLDVEVAFAVAAIPDHLATMIGGQGMDLIRLPVPAPPDAEMPLPDTAQLADAEATLAAAGHTDWIVVDSYALGLPFEKKVKAAGHRLLVIDDLARTHHADLLLDQTLHRDAEARYAASSGRQLLGPRYALLRPEFAEHRAGIHARDREVGRLFVMMSGSDPDDSCNLVLDAISAAGAQDIAADIVVGSGHPALARLRERAAANPNWTLHIDSDGVAELMARADLGIGAGGSATWERACLGLPTVAICLAANQAELLREAAAAGLLLVAQPPQDAASVAEGLRLLLDNGDLRSAMSAQCLAQVDGAGARRVASAMRGALARVRPAAPDDCDKLLEWRNAPHVRAASRETAVIGLADHRAWYQRTLAASDRWLLVGDVEGVETGVVRFDRIEPDVAEVSIYTSPAARPGDGTALLAAAEAWLAEAQPDMQAVQAEYRADNLPSRTLFSNAGYAPLPTAGYGSHTMITRKRLRSEKASG